MNLNEFGLPGQQRQFGRSVIFPQCYAFFPHKVVHYSPRAMRLRLAIAIMLEVAKEWESGISGNPPVLAII